MILKVFYRKTSLAMKLYLLTIFAVLVLLVLPPAANAQAQIATEEPTPSNSTIPQDPPGSLGPPEPPGFPGSHGSPSPPGLPRTPGHQPGASVASDDDVSPPVQDGDVKVPLIREPRDAFF